MVAHDHNHGVFVETMGDQVSKEFADDAVGVLCLQEVALVWNPDLPPRGSPVLRRCPVGTRDKKRDSGLDFIGFALTTAGCMKRRTGSTKWGH